MDGAKHETESKKIPVGMAANHPTASWMERSEAGLCGPADLAPRCKQQVRFSIVLLLSIRRSHGIMSARKHPLNHFQPILFIQSQ